MRLEDRRQAAAQRQPSGEPCLGRVQVDERRLLLADDSRQASRVQE
jgi:hypothetical protein